MDKRVNMPDKGRSPRGANEPGQHIQPQIPSEKKGAGASETPPLREPKK